MTDSLLKLYWLHRVTDIFCNQLKNSCVPVLVNVYAYVVKI